MKLISDYSKKNMKYLILGLLSVVTFVFFACKLQLTVTIGKQECKPCPPCTSTVDRKDIVTVFTQKDAVMVCTQAYYPTDDISAYHFAGENFLGRTDHTNHAGSHIQSMIWTAGGVPFMGRFYLNFDLSGYYHTKKTRIQNTSLYLYSYPTSEGHSSNTETNRHVFNRIVEEWNETTLTWSHQPNVDETTGVVTDHIPGDLDEPSRQSYVFNLNDILLKNGTLMADYKGISCRPYQEDIDDSYRKVTFTDRNYGNAAYFSTLKVEYAIPTPQIEFKKNVFSVTNNEDLKALFGNVQYILTVNGAEYTGETVHYTKTDKHCTVGLQIIVTDNIGEINRFSTSETFNTRKTGN
jgi:hypothetical protein